MSNSKCGYAEIGDPDCPTALERDELKARLAEASALISSQDIRLMEADDVAAQLVKADALIRGYGTAGFLERCERWCSKTPPSAASQEDEAHA